MESPYNNNNANNNEITNKDNVNDEFPFETDIFQSNLTPHQHNSQTKEKIKQLSQLQKDKRRIKTRQKAKEKKSTNATNIKELTNLMSESERIEYYTNLKLNKKRKEESIANAINSPYKIIFDLDYLIYMKQHDIKSMAHQLTYAYSLNKYNKTKISFYLTSYIDQAKEELEKMGAGNWYCHFYKEDFYQIDELKQFKRNFVYLTPDSHEDLDDVDDQHIYIIGGLVDKPTIKDRSLYKVQQIINESSSFIIGGEEEKIFITSKRLPLRKYIDNLHNPVLNINTVVEILSKYLDTKDWKTAIESSLPMRMKNK